MLILYVVLARAEASCMASSTVTRPGWLPLSCSRGDADISNETLFVHNPSVKTQHSRGTSDGRLTSGFFMGTRVLLPFV